MLSYIFIGILPLIILGSFFYYGNRMSVRSEVEKSNAAKLSLVLQKMDYITEKMNSVAYHFSNTSTAENLNGVRNKAIDIDEGMIQSQLATYAKIISEEENATRMLLYLRGDTYLYTIEGRMKYLEFETQMQRYGDLNEVAFFTALNSIITERTIHVGAAGENGDSIVWFLYPIPYMNNIPIATMGIGYDENMLNDLIETYYPLNSSIYLFNNQMTEIYTSWTDGLTDADKKEIEDQIRMWRRQGGKMEKIRINGRQYILMQDISASSGFTMLTITSKEDFYAYESPFGIWFTVLLLIALAGGVLLAFLMSRTTYEPVRKLMEHISAEDVETESSGENEFEKIHHRWEDIQSKNEELNALVNRQRPMVVSSCLRKILKGKFENREEMEAMMKSAIINMNYPYFFVLLVSAHAEDYAPEKNLKILSITENAAFSNLHLYGIDMLKDDSIAIIVNSMEKETKDVDIREMVAEWLWKELKENCGMRGPVYVGRIYADPMEICRSFIEAAALADDYRILGNRHFLLFEEIQGEETQTQYPVLEQAVYIQCLKQANEKAALEALHNMIHEVEKLKSFVMMQCLCFDIINVAIRTLDSMKGFEIQNLDMKKLCTFGSLSEFEEKVSALTVQICQQYSKFKTKQNDQLKAEILNYVNGHYGDCGMGLDLLSEQFGISINQLSRFFKQETGCTFIQYITMLRMDKARTLLASTGKSITEIAGETGFRDYRVFTKVFKSAEGESPSAFRSRFSINFPETC